MIYITAIRMSPPDSREYEHITDLQWRNPETDATGENSKQSIVDWINNKNGVAKVEATPDVAVVVVDGNPPYVRTVANDTYTDNLLSLPRF